MDWLIVDEQIAQWVKEDMNNGDITTEALIAEDLTSNSELIAKEDGIVAGLTVMQRVFLRLDREIDFEFLVQEGDRVNPGEVIARISGRTKTILQGERTALNILQRMSGVATETAKYVEALKGLKVRLVDTRKTTPGLRALEKYAVKIAGGYNHRFNLSEAVLIKDNHIQACGGIKAALKNTREKVPHTMKIEIEVETLEQLEEALNYEADIVLLDNMGTDKMKEAVLINKGRALLEASGNIGLHNLRKIAETGVDIISVGAITHSVKALDISLRIKV